MTAAALPAAAPDWQARTAEALLAPAVAARDLAARMLADAEPRGPDEFAADLRKVVAAAARLVDGLEDALAPTAPAPLPREVRHELRTPLNHVLGYAELWLEDAAEYLLEGFVGDLRELRRLAAGVLDQLNRATADARAADAAARPHTCDLLRRGRVLVVDDNEANRDILRRRLELDGHQVAEAADGAAAVDQARCWFPDVVLLDVVMPGVNGVEALRRLKADARLAHIPVIMVTALSDVGGAAGCIEMGAEDYLPKPCDPVLLRARVGACLEKKRLRDREAVYVRELDRERRRADELLHGILPPEVVGELKETGTVRPRRFNGVAVLFADVVNFTPFCDRNPPERVVELLQRLIEGWEEAARRHQAEKVKTVGDCMMVAAGLLRRTDDHPVRHAVRCGRDMIAATRALGVGWDLRVGVHWGPVVAGVIGRQKYLFDLWGDTVNTAARMESHGLPGHVTLSGDAWAHAAGACDGEPHGMVEVKGKGSMPVYRVAAG
ncbi:MAG: adenylate/guanylate cyclase domain-containing protein [Gemmataceae bacterium]